MEAEIDSHCELRRESAEQTEVVEINADMPRPYREHDSFLHGWYYPGKTKPDQPLAGNLLVENVMVRATRRRPYSVAGRYRAS